MTFIAAAALTILASTAQTDTTLAVTPGARLSVFNLGGQVHVTSWPKNAVRVRAAHAPEARVLIERRGNALQVTSRGRAPGSSVQYDIIVPRWINLHINGLENEVRVEDVDGDVLVETVRGGVDVRGGRGLVSASSMDGGVRVEGTRGRVQASSVNEGVWVMDTEGEVVANSINGTVVLDRIVSDLVEAMSANGDLVWDGDFKERGRYQFGTHNGDILVVTKSHPNATVQVRTFGGGFESTFPMEVRGEKARDGMNFTFGDGSALLDVESFQGQIQLLRADTEKAKTELETRLRDLRENYRERIRLRQREVERQRDARRRAADRDER